VADLDATNRLTGVAVAGELVVVGLGGEKHRRPVGQKWIDDSALAPHDDLHAVWLDGAGGGLAVGGNYNAPASSARQGVVVRLALE
jgi:hypothetical protein